MQVLETFLCSLTWHCWEDHTAAPRWHQGYRCLWPWRLCTPRSHCSGTHGQKWYLEVKSQTTSVSAPFTRSNSCSRLQGPKVSKDLVAFALHLAVDAADDDLLDHRLQNSAIVLHTCTRAEDQRDKSGQLVTKEPKPLLFFEIRAKVMLVQTLKMEVSVWGGTNHESWLISWTVDDLSTEEGVNRLKSELLHHISAMTAVELSINSGERILILQE